MFPAGNENGGKVAAQDSAGALRHDDDDDDNDDDDDAKAERLEDLAPKPLGARRRRQGQGRSDWSVPPPPA